MRVDIRHDYVVVFAKVMPKSTRNTNSESGERVVTMRLSEDVLARLREQAQAERRSFSGHMRFVIDRWLEEEEAA